MIINNKRVQGLYIYNQDSRSIEFTKDDLVVSGNSIYVCDAEVISGIDPAEDTLYEYYHPYPGSLITSASEYFQSIKEGSSENKYVSDQAIMGILQGYQFGLDKEGVITDWINQDGDTTLKISQITDRPIDNLMLTETLNRGMVKISHLLNQIYSGEVSGQPFSTIFGFLEKSDVEYQLILSQYTYQSSDTMFIRIQELMSPLTGVSVYRYMSWESGEFPSDGNTISSWRNVFSYSTAIQHKLDALQSYYDTVSQQLTARVASLSGSFRFQERYIGSQSEGSSYLDNLEDGVYTVCVEGNSGGHTYSDSVVVRLKAGMSTYSIYFNKLGGSLKVSVGRIELVGGSSNKLVSVYGRRTMT